MTRTVIIGHTCGLCNKGTNTLRKFVSVQVLIKCIGVPTAMKGLSSLKHELNGGKLRYVRRDTL